MYLVYCHLQSYPVHTHMSALAYCLPACHMTLTGLLPPTVYDILYSRWLTQIPSYSRGLCPPSPFHFPFSPSSLPSPPSFLPLYLQHQGCTASMVQLRLCQNPIWPVSSTSLESNGFHWTELWPSVCRQSVTYWWSRKHRMLLSKSNDTRSVTVWRNICH